MTDPRTLLETERAETVRRLASLTRDFAAVVSASYDDNADDEHDPEGATIAFERSQLDAVIQQVRGHLEEIAAALDRLDAGTYGRCLVCAGPISAPRLEARPVARTCVGCAS